MKTLLMLAMCACVIPAAAGDDGLATEKDFKIVTDGSTTKLKNGEKGTLTLQVLAMNGFKVSQETPFTVKLAPTAGLKLETQQLQRKDLVDPKAKDPQVKTAFTATAKGAQAVKADLVFFLCTDKLCQRMTTSQELKVAVE